MRGGGFFRPFFMAKPCFASAKNSLCHKAVKYDITWSRAGPAEGPAFGCLGTAWFGHRKGFVGTGRFANGLVYRANRNAQLDNSIYFVRHPVAVPGPEKRL